MTRHRAFTAVGRNEQRQRYALSVSASEEKAEEEKGDGQGERSGEEKLGERGTVSKTTQRGEDPWEGARERGRRCVPGILAKLICIVSRSVGDNVSSFPFRQIFYRAPQCLLSAPTKA